MKKIMKKIITIFLISIVFPIYYVGDTVSLSDQNIVLDVCDATSEYSVGDEIKLADWNGDLNGGDYHVIWLELSASWWPSCYQSIGTMDNIHSNWGDEEAVAMALELSDPNQPYSCATWGGQFDDSEPLIVNGGSPYYHWWGMFEDTYVPANAFIDHKMRLHYKTNSLSYATANSSPPAFVALYGLVELYLSFSL